MQLLKIFFPALIWFVSAQYMCKKAKIWFGGKSDSPNYLRSVVDIYFMYLLLTHHRLLAIRLTFPLGTSPFSLLDQGFGWAWIWETHTAQLVNR